MSVTAAPRALIVKLGAIGDVLMAVPGVHALHQKGYEIDWICGQAVAPILNAYPWIQTIVVDDRALLKGGKAAQLKALAAVWKILLGRHYELCVTLYYDARYRWLTMPVRPQRSVSLSKTDRRTMLLSGRHHTDEFARVLLGIEDGERPVSLSPIHPGRLPASPLDRLVGRSRVVLAPAGAKNMLRDDALRRWPLENYVALASILLPRGLEVVLIGGPEDTWAVSAFEGLAVTDMIGRVSLLETLALLDESDAMVTHDTGPLHLAGITRVGIVSIFGPTDPRGRLPQRADTVAIWGGEGFACRPCYDGVNYAPCSDNGCMKQVTVEMAMREVEAVLEQRRCGSRPPRVVTPVSTVVTKL